MLFRCVIFTILFSTDLATAFPRLSATLPSLTPISSQLCGSAMGPPKNYFRQTITSANVEILSKWHLTHPEYTKGHSTKGKSVLFRILFSFSLVT